MEKSDDEEHDHSEGEKYKKKKSKKRFGLSRTPWSMKLWISAFCPSVTR